MSSYKANHPQKRLKGMLTPAGHKNAARAITRSRIPAMLVIIASV